MKKLLLILALIPLFAMGQKKHVVKEYCKVYLSQGKPMLQRGYTERSIVLTDSIGNEYKKITDTELLTIMSEKGWEFVPYKFDGNSETFLFCRPKSKQKEDK